MPSMSCLRLLVQLIRFAASRIFWTAGSSRPMRIAMIAITTNSSMSVNARGRLRSILMSAPVRKEEGRKARARTGGAPGGLLGVHLDGEVVRPGLDLQGQELVPLAPGRVGVVDHDLHVVRPDDRPVVVLKRAQPEVAVLVGEPGRRLAGFQLALPPGRGERDGGLL